MTRPASNLGQIQKYRNILYFGLFFSAVAILLDLFINQMLIQKYQTDQEALVTHELGTIRARLEESLNTNLFVIYGMAAYISVQKGIASPQFEELASVLLEQSNALKNIAIAPDFVIERVYPLEGNEAIIGLDYRTVSDQWNRAVAARNTGRMAVAGPLNLVQGGRGLVARVPVFVGTNKRFWGLVSSVIDFDELLEQSGFQSESKWLNIAIRGRDGTGERGEVFGGQAELFDSDAGAITMPVSLPSGYWQMAAVPKGGWKKHHPYEWAIRLAVWLTAVVFFFGGVYRMQSKLALVESENRLKAMSVASLDALIMIDSKDTVMFWNPAAEAMFGYTETEMIGQKLHHVVVQPKTRDEALSGLKKFEKSGQGPVMDSVLEMEAVRRSGEVFPVERSVAAFKIREKWYAVGSLRDITARKKAENLLTELATTDSLTGLSNRRHFMEQAEMQVQQAIRYQKHLSLMMFDLDHFKHINDTYGHDAGDKVLQAVASTVKQELRVTDIIGRVGGEEFAVAMPQTDRDMAVMAAERIRVSLMETRVETDTDTIRFTVSIGLVQLGSGAATLSELMKRADESLYEAKRTGRNRVVVST